MPHTNTTTVTEYRVLYDGELLATTTDQGLAERLIAARAVAGHDGHLYELQSRTTTTTHTSWEPTDWKPL